MMIIIELGIEKCRNNKGINLDPLRCLTYKKLCSYTRKRDNSETTDIYDDNKLNCFILY